MHSLSLSWFTRSAGRPLQPLLLALTLLIAALLPLMTPAPASAHPGPEPAHRLDRPGETGHAAVAQTTPEPTPQKTSLADWRLDVSLDVTEGSVYDVAWSPDGRSIATLDYLGITIWDMTGTEATASSS